jgi:iron transport multicopper oxidase
LFIIFTCLNSYPEDTIITLADWYCFCVAYIHRCANILARYHTPSPAAGLIPTPDSVLINGLGRYSGGPSSPLAVINVSAGKRYRFRLVSISCDPNFVFSIDSHNLVGFF